MTQSKVSPLSGSTAMVRRQWQGTCEQLHSALEPLGICGASLYDERGQLLRMSSRVAGQERAAAAAFTRFGRRGLRKICVFPLGLHLGRERSAIVVPVVDNHQRLVGAAMCVLDTVLLKNDNDLVRKLLTADAFTKALRDFAERRMGGFVGESGDQATVAPAVERLSAESALAMDLSASRRLRRLVAPRYSSESKRVIQPAPASPLPKRRPSLALFVQRLVSLREDVEPIRCEVVTPLLRRSPTTCKTRTSSLSERRTLIELCRWGRRQPAGDREGMPLLWFKLSMDAVLDTTFIQFAADCVKSGGFPSERLGFEIPADDAAACMGDLTGFAFSIKRLRCFLVLDNFAVHPEHVDLLGLPCIRMIKLEPAIATQMRSDTWLRKRVAGIAQSTRALGIKIVVKRIASRSEALWYRDFGVDFVQSQALSPAEPIDVLTTISPRVDAR